MTRLPILCVLLSVAACGAGSDDDGTGDVPDYVAFGTSASTVTVVWQPIAGATAYTVLRGSSPNDLAPIATVAASEPGFLDTGLTAQTTYTYGLEVATAGGTTSEPTMEATTTTDEILVTGDPTPVGAPITATVGAAGASIPVPAAGATLTVPPGAAPDGTLVTLQPFASPYAELGEVGVSVTSAEAFTAPATLAFGYDELDDDGPENVTVLIHEDDGSWVSQPGALDTAARTATITLPVAAPAKPGQALWGAPIKYHDAIRLRVTYVNPGEATVQVKKTQALSAVGLFSDDPCDGDDELLCLGISAIGLAAGQIAPGDALRPARREMRPLKNTKPGFENDWTVEKLIGGSPAYGTVAKTGNSGATFTAPAAKPTKNPVAVRFTSVDISGKQRRPAYPRPAMMTIDDPGSVVVTGMFDDPTSMAACPDARVELRDQLSFAVTLDSNLAYHVDVLSNGVTAISNIIVSPLLQSVGWDTGNEPEVFTMTSGTVTELTGTHQLEVKIDGTAIAGACTVTFGDGSVMTLPGTTYYPHYTVVLNEDLSIVPQPASLWTFTAMLTN